ncbi:UDP-glucose 4-epimerase GalE [Streptomyces hokutonensis]|uniref:UDP-glucose 4-epimerase GalE n=1 Tax=Streptomyces hokutonensis TaxID=1306990 RepID=UPI0003A6950F|nr:UDP-glucose 4-epimerase GalE [Streptomyces hokutonensis]
MRVLVSGGAGYVGSFTVRSLLSAGHEVLVVDDLSTGRREAVSGVPLELGDIRDELRLESVFANFRPHAVMHFAGLKSSEESMTEIGRYMDVNVRGLTTVLECSRRHGVRLFVFSSSCSVYGTPGCVPVTEDVSAAPESPYGESKSMGEHLVQWYGRLANIRFANLRYFNAAGAAADGSHGAYVPASVREIFPMVIRACLGMVDGIRILGSDFPTSDGTAVRDYIHVEDLAKAHLRVLEGLDDSDVSGSYNVGCGTGVSVQEVVQTVRMVSGRRPPVSFGARRPGDPAGLWADTTRIKEAFGWEPVHDLAAIAETAWRWHRDNPSTLGPDSSSLSGR